MQHRARDAETQRAADERQQRGLDDQLANDRARARADGAPNRDFSRAAERPNQQQAADVDAGDDKEQRDRRRQHSDHEPPAADHLVEERPDLATDER